MRKQARQEAAAAAAALDQALAADPQLYTDSVKFAASRLRARGKTSATRDFAAEDLVQDAFEAVLSGRRAAPATWSRQEVQSVINSVLWAKCHRKANGMVVLRADTVHPSCHVAANDDGRKHSEDAQYGRAIITLFRAQIGDDPDLLALVDAILSGAVKRRELAAFLDVEPTSITNILKRLTRRAREFRDKHVIGKSVLDEAPLESGPAAVRTDDVQKHSRS